MIAVRMALTVKHRRAALLLGCLLLSACSKSAGAERWQELPVVPPLGGAVRAHVRAIAAQGREAGRDPLVFIKVGDSITESPTFLQDMACAEPR
jgi:hypothetical protein